MLEVRNARKAAGVTPSYKRVDTCAAEFAAQTPYMYSTYDGDCECEATTARKVRQCKPSRMCDIALTLGVACARWAMCAAA